jgi:hypothetical protein
VFLEAELREQPAIAKLAANMAAAQVRNGERRTARS